MFHARPETLAFAFPFERFITSEFFMAQKNSAPTREYVSVTPVDMEKSKQALVIDKTSTRKHTIFREVESFDTQGYHSKHCVFAFGFPYCSAIGVDLGTTHSCSSTVDTKLGSASRLKVLTRALATTTKICIEGGSSQTHVQPSKHTDTPPYSSGH